MSQPSTVTMAAPFRVKSIYEYSSPHDDDLNFAVGQIITVTEEEDDDWYSGEYVDENGAKREGIFPRNFVEKFEPTAPPRPTRTRTKKDPEAAQPPPSGEVAAPLAPLPARDDPAPSKYAEPKSEETDEPAQRSPKIERAGPAIAPPAASYKPSEPLSTPASPPAAPKASEHPAAAPIPVPSSASKAKPAPPPPAAEKPSSNSFRDRIAAFNKPAAPPVAPFKPSGLSGSGGGAGFIKKPFVAPPPSRNAYVPPPREAPSANVYRREEDPEIKEKEAENLGQAERAGLVPTELQQDDGEDDQPKPTSLKERIALLQKQQLEQAQRHADAAAKKEKPKRPPPPPQKRSESTTTAEAATEADEEPLAPSLERRETGETGTRTSTDEVHATRAPLPPRRRSSKGHDIEPVHDGNEADMSGGGDTTEGQDDTTERDDSDAVSRRVSRVGVASSTAAAAETEGGEEEENAEEVEEEDEDVDPEVKRKEELRARMAKMSGGMGFHGMFGAPAPPTAASSKKKTSRAEAGIGEGEEATSPISRAAPPIPTPMAIPFLENVKLHHEPMHVEEDEPARPTRGAPPPLPARGAGDAGQDEEQEEEATTPAPTAEPKSMSEASK